jgi:nucleotidyltransferase AbiEii toxin of type IV toxin-antitoxin system
MTDPLTLDQAHALETLAQALDPSFYLAGGVAVGVHLHHRSSRDLDLFSPTADPAAYADTIAQTIPDARVVSRSPGTLHLEVGGVPASALRYAYPSLREPERVAGVPIAVASRDDLLAMKLSAVAGRGAARDFWDLHDLLLADSRSLDYALDAFRRKYAREDIGHVVRSLVYFADAEGQPLPRGMTPDLWATIRSDFETWVQRA